VTDHSLEATPPSEMIANARQILGGDVAVHQRRDFIDLRIEDWDRVQHLLETARVRAQKLETEVAQMRGALDHIAARMCASLPDDFRLSEIQDYLTMAGYDVPLRSYRDETVSPQRRDETP